MNEALDAYETAGSSPPKTLAERKAGTTCTRCGEQRWPFKNWTEPHTCHRCLEALAGGDAIDPLPTEAQRAARAAAGSRLQGHSFLAHGGVGKDFGIGSTAQSEAQP